MEYATVDKSKKMATPVIEYATVDKSMKRVTPVMEYAQVDKSKKRVSQEEHKQIAGYDDTMMESKVPKASAVKCFLTFLICMKIFNDVYICTYG